MKQKGTFLIKGIRNFLHIKNKDYPKITFRLSVIGFVGSIGFYIGVLKDLGDNGKEKIQEIENLKIENETLKKQVNLLIEKY